MNDLSRYIKESRAVKENMENDPAFLAFLQKTIEVITDCYKNGGKVLVAGNGGSAADAQHFAAELVCRFKRERKGMPAIALTTDTSILTAWSNDYDFSSVFARQVEAFGTSGDVFLGISTSGNSKNIIEAMQKAKEEKLTTVGLLGSNGGKIKDLCDIALIVPSTNTPRIQESHTMLIHIICEEVEKTFA